MCYPRFIEVDLIIGAQIAALEIMMSLLTHLSNAISTPGVPRIHLPHFRKVVKALVLCPPSARAGHSATHALNATGRLEADIRDKFVDVHLSVHDDIRWFFLREATYVKLSSHYLSHC